MDLHPNEIKLLKVLAKRDGIDILAISKISDLSPDSVRKAVLWASTKNLVTSRTEDQKIYTLTEEGEHWLNKNTLPELEIYKKVNEGMKSIEQLKNLKDFNIGFMWARKKNIVKVDGSTVSPVKNDRTDKDLSELNKVKHNSKDLDISAIEILKKRGLVSEKVEKSQTIFITKKGLEISRSEDQDKIGELTPEIIKSGEWVSKGFRSYDVSLPSYSANAGKRHITSLWIEKIRKIFLDMGFKETKGPLVESSFWCFDTLYQPQDHPSRELADTFFMKTPSTTKLPDVNLVTSVKNAHENGGNSGSSGWMYRWSEDVAKKAVLRTHTTAVSSRNLYKLTPPAKMFCIGRAFRNETVDYKHLPEFTQIEGIVADENVTFRDLLGYLKEFYWRLGFEKIRFRPAYFPYTEMSVEPEVYFEDKKEWVELGGAGMLRPEVTNPLGVDVPVLAWGLSLERPIMLMTELNDIRNFYFKNDLKLLRNSVVTI